MDRSLAVQIARSPHVVSIRKDDSTWVDTAAVVHQFGSKLSGNSEMFQTNVIVPKTIGEVEVKVSTSTYFKFDGIVYRVNHWRKLGDYYVLEGHSNVQKVAK